MAKIFLTTVGAGTFSAPGDWPGMADTVECLGGGGAGSLGASSQPGQGGGGGGYSKKNNVSFANGAPYSIGAGGTGVGNANGNDGGDTWIGHATYASAFCAAKGGKGGAVANSGSSSLGAGGSAGLGIGDVKYSGGDGTAFDAHASGGGGAAGPNGAGGSGGAGAGTTDWGGGGGGGANGGGTGGYCFDASFGAGGTGNAGGGAGGDGGNRTAQTAGSPGSPGTTWDSTHGPGGGGGGGMGHFGGVFQSGAGGLYGGGSGAGTNPVGSSDPAPSGAQGIIVITYTPGGSPATKTAEVTLADASGSPRANLQNLKWAWWDFPTPNLFTTAPAAKGSIGSTNGSGIFTADLPDSTLTNGQIGWLIVTDSDGTISQSPSHKAFSGPVAIVVT